jgi:hypothetical protein
LPGLLAPDFSCRYDHTGEEFDRDSWVRLNADYPGFQDFVLEECVTGVNQNQPEQFGVATFMTTRSGLIVDMTELWTDFNQAAPTGRRPE